MSIQPYPDNPAPKHQHTPSKVTDVRIFSAAFRPDVLNVSWTPPVNLGDCTGVTYEVDYSKDDDTQTSDTVNWTSRKTTTIPMCKVPEGVTVVRVRAVSDAGHGPWTEGKGESLSDFVFPADSWE